MPTQKLKDFTRRDAARASVGRLKDAIADSEKAVAKAADYAGEGSRIELFRESQLRLNGDYRKPIALLEKNGAKLNVTQPPHQGAGIWHLVRAPPTIFFSLVRSTRPRVTSNATRGAPVGSARVAECPTLSVELRSSHGGWQRPLVSLLVANTWRAEAAYTKAEARYRMLW